MNTTDDLPPTSHASDQPTPEDTTSSSVAHEPLSRRHMLRGSVAALAAAGLAGTAGLGTPRVVHAEGDEQLRKGSDSAKPRIVLVHGAWADGTSWQELIPLLERAGYPVIAVQNPLSGLVADVATTKRVLDAEAKLGPVIAVGHSYGGAVITGAADNANIKALVYIAAFAPEVGEPIGTYLGTYPTELGQILRPDDAGFVYLARERFRAVFAADVDYTTARVMAAAQKPAFGEIFGEAPAIAAWKTIPSWYMVAKNDKALSPDMERFFAARMQAKTVEVDASHVAYISRPDAVFKLIDKAARAVT